VPCSARALLRGLRQLGHEVTFYEKNVEYYARRRGFRSCEFCRLVLYPSWDDVRAEALAEAAASDVVMTGSYLPEGARISEEALGLAGPVRVSYDLDAPITLAALENGQPEYLHAGQIPGFDLYLSFTGGEILNELRQRWRARRAEPLYGCVDPDVHAPVPPQPVFRCDLSYMGTYATDRQQQLDELFLAPARELTGSAFLLAGSLYPAARDCQWPPNVRCLEHVAAGDHAALYSSSRATLNLTRGGMAARGGYCPSGRFFEAACGAPILTDWFPGLPAFFAPGEELLVVRSATDVMAALRAGDGELAKFAGRARQRTLDEHTGLRRARQLERILESLSSKPQA
jgi:spore maturation protein CgeB